MHILALEPYYGGSHQAFLDRWQAESRHQWTNLTLPANKWQWRVRHGAMTFAERLRERIVKGESWDLLFSSSMLNLAEFKGIAPRQVSSLPSVSYFHENQITYPIQGEGKVDMQWGLINLTTALAADAVWFNTAWHRDEFLTAAARLRQAMPNQRPKHVVKDIEAKCKVYPQGVEACPPRGPRAPGPIRILWAARWEHDKNFDHFAASVKLLEESDTDFRLSVIGEQFGQTPKSFSDLKELIPHRIDRWGYQDSRVEYRSALMNSDIIVSTSLHEFFGISVAEAVAAGCYPLVPARLAYPEVLNSSGGNDDFFYPDGSPPSVLTECIIRCAESLSRGLLWDGDNAQGRKAVSKYLWPNLIPRLDNGLELTQNSTTLVP